MVVLWFYEYVKLFTEFESVSYCLWPSTQKWQTCIIMWALNIKQSLRKTDFGTKHFMLYAWNPHTCFTGVKLHA